MKMKEFVSKFMLKDGMKMIDKITDGDVEAKEAIELTAKFAIALWSISDENCNEQLEHIHQHELAKRTNMVYIPDRKSMVICESSELSYLNEDGSTTIYTVKDYLAEVKV